jgi:hypothetical protein
MASCARIPAGSRLFFRFLVMTIPIAITIAVTIPIPISAGVVHIQVIHHHTQQSTAQCPQRFSGTNHHAATILVRSHHQHDGIHQSSGDGRVTDGEDRGSIHDDLVVASFGP